MDFRKYIAGRIELLHLCCESKGHVFDVKEHIHWAIFLVNNVKEAKAVSNQTQLWARYNGKRILQSWVCATLALEIV